LDVHKRTCYGTVTDDEGHIVKSGRFSSDSEGISEFMEGLEEAQIAMEAGYCWQPIYDRLVDAGHDVRLAHPQKVKAIAEAKVKTDKVDSETLAHLLRAGLLPESYVPPRDIRELRDLVRRRAFLVGMRTKLKNRIHAELAKRSIDLGSPLFTRGGRELLGSLGLESVDQLLPVMEALDAQISQVSGSLRKMSGEDSRAQLLTTIPGVGYYVAALLVSEIGDVNRFPDAERLCSYAGLVPLGEKERGHDPPWGHHEGGFQVDEVGLDSGGSRPRPLRYGSQQVLSAARWEEVGSVGCEGYCPEDA
jgi:transposase